MTPEDFNARVAELAAANPKGVPVDEYLGLMVELIQGSITAAYGIPAHVTVFVGTRIEEVKVCTTLSNEQLLSLMTAFSERMALRHVPVKQPPV